MTNIDNNQLHSLIQRLVDSGALGRSPIYEKLLNYFADQVAIGKASSEHSVATDVFEKPDDYDVSSDSTVRVYIYNLRKKLDAYYAELGQHEAYQLHIPKGEYRIVVKGRDNDHSEQTIINTEPVDTNGSPTEALTKRTVSLTTCTLLMVAAVVITAIVTSALLKTAS